jgi:hypothetical protein
MYNDTRLINILTLKKINDVLIINNKVMLVTSVFYFILQKKYFYLEKY